MKKKLLSLVLCGVLLALTGCGQVESPDTTVSEVNDSKLTQDDIKAKEDVIKDSQAHVDIEEID